MTDIAIRCEGLGKQYRIGERERYKALRDTITDTMTAPFRWLRNPQSAIRNPRSSSFWALKDVSFEIKRGEVVGIIGRNGAGKSTLLKVLSRITAPTTGEVGIRGRVGSLLEVGTGFHPELTGRENIYLNGAILGMKKTEIGRKFDEIVAFAEIEQFIDTPVKRYSSGMFVRLAFSVAAHLEPEILIVDEVLAVGDVAFQKKCLGKIKEVKGDGRTVILVSHNMAAVQSLCQIAILLSSGKITTIGSTDEVVRHHLSSAKHIFGRHSLAPTELQYNSIIRNAYLVDEHENVTTSIPIGASVTVRMHLSPHRRISRPIFGIGVDNYLGVRVVGFNSIMNTVLDIEAISNTCMVECKIPSLLLSPGEYRIKLAIIEFGSTVEEIEDAFTFTVEATDWFGTGRLPSSTQGITVCKANWKICFEPVANI
jgi:lipopolysaccharide transport system ATP-binding protein